MGRSLLSGSVEANKSVQRGVLEEVISGDRLAIKSKSCGFPLWVCSHLFFTFYGWNSLHIHSQRTLGDLVTFQVAFQNCFSLSTVGRFLAFSFLRRLWLSVIFSSFVQIVMKKKKLRIKIHGNSHTIKRSLNLARMAEFTILASFLGLWIKFRKTVIT